MWGAKMEENNNNKFSLNMNSKPKKPKDPDDKYINMGEFTTIFIGLLAFIICAVFKKVALGLFLFGLSLVFGRLVGKTFKELVLKRKNKQN
jgi:Na+/proline symporter